MGFRLRDELLKVTRALPAAASASVQSSGIDLGHGARGDFLAKCELLLEAPAVTTTMAPDAKTLTYLLEHDDDAEFGSVATLQTLLVQTGAGGAGAAAAEARVRLPVDVKRYVRLKITSGVDITDSSAVSATMSLLF